MVKECTQWARQAYGRNAVMATLKIVTGATSGHERIPAKNTQRTVSFEVTTEETQR